MDLYIIYSLRSNAWVGDSVPYTSDVSKAMKLEREGALRICQAHKLQGKMVAFPVRLADVKEVLE